MADAKDVGVWNAHALQLVESPVYPSPEIMEWLEQKAKEISPKSVLDLGCGVGLMSSLFTPDQYQGIDQNEKMLAAARDLHPEYSFSLNNGLSIEFESESFDMIFTRAVVQHNSEPDKSRLVSEISRVLVPEGYYLFAEGEFLSEPNSEDRVVSYLSGWGLVLIETKYSAGYLFQKAL